eukprot:750553-Hanusia_phi.AAC.4
MPGAGNLNLSFAYVEGESLLMALKVLQSCTAQHRSQTAGSRGLLRFCLHVLRALGVDEDMAHTSIRFGIGRFTTEEEVDYAVNLVEKHVHRLREMSPLWEMVQASRHLPPAWLLCSNPTSP